MNKEKRRFLRFGCTLPAEIIKLEPEKCIVGEANIDDFSREGIKLTLSFNLKPGTNMDLSIRFPKSKEIASITGEVIWSQRKDSTIQLGLKIKDMDTEAKSKIFDLLYSNWIKDRSKNMEKALTKK
jgi:hypothetical protein